MKIAICITGHMRQSVDTFPHSIPVFKLIEELKNYDLNISYFASTWKTNGHNIGLHDSDKDNIDISILENIPNCIYEVEDDTIHDKYVDMIAHKYKDVYKGDEPEIPPHHMQKYQIISMFRKMSRCYKMVNNNFDFIFRTRFDCTFDINAVVDCLTRLQRGPNCYRQIHIPNNYDFGGDDAPGGGRINDTMAIGYKQDMDTYMKTFDWIETDDCVKYMMDNNLWFCPHSILRHNILKNNIFIVRENFGCKVHRKNGQVM